MKLLLLLLTLNINSCFSQICTVVDKSSKKEVEFTSIANTNRTKFVYSNELGQFDISIFNKTDSLVFSHLSYEKVKISFEDINIIVYLNPKITSLDEVIIKPTSIKTKEIGLSLTKKKSLLMAQRPTTKIAVLVEDLNAEGKMIRKLVYNIIKRECKSYFKLYLRKNEAGTPGEVLINKEISVNSDLIKRDKLIFDITDFGITFPKEGVFVCIEYLGELDSKTGLFYGFSSNYQNSVCYHESMYVILAQNLSNHASFFYDIYNTKWERPKLMHGKIFSPAFGLIVEQ